MSKKLKVLALVLVAILSISVFAGCKKTGETNGSSAVQTQSEVTPPTGGDVESEDGNNSEDEGNQADDPADEGNESEDSGNQNNTGSRPSGGSRPTGTKVDVTPHGTWPIVKNKITVEIMGLSLPSRGDPEKMSQFNYYEKISNIKTKYIGVEEGKYTERKTLALQSGDMPDMFTATSWDDVALAKYTSGKKPALVDVSKYLDEYAPNIKKVFEEDKVAAALNTTAEGKIYTLPGLTRAVPNYDHWLNIRKDWLDLVGLDIPTTPNEFLTVLRAFRDQIPAITGNNNIDPFSISNWSANFAMSWWGVKTTTGGIGIDRNKKVYYPYATKNARAAATFWNALYHEKGLMNKTDIIGDSKGYWAAFTEHISTGNVGSFVWSYLQHGAFSSDLLKNYVAIPFPVANFPNSEIKVSASSQPFNNVPSRGGEVITSSCENVPAMLRYWDYFYTPDGIMLGNFGAEETGNYTKQKNGTYKMSSKMADAQADYKNAMGWAMGINEAGVVIPELIIRNKKDPNYENAVYDAYNEAALKTYAAANKKYPTYYMADYQKTAEEIAQLRKFDSAGFDNAHGCMQSYISGYWKIADFDTKVDGWNQKGLQQYIALYQKIVNRVTANNKDALIDSGTYAIK